MLPHVQTSPQTHQPPFQQSPTKSSTNNELSLPAVDKQTTQLLSLYCQPCFKRGLINEPMYVNLNEFESNRYICEGCSFGQSYIIELEKDFKKDVREYVKLETVKLAKLGDSLAIFQRPAVDQAQIKSKDLTNLNNQHKPQSPPQTHLITLDPSIDPSIDSSINPSIDPSAQPTQPTTMPQFTRNVHINHNDFSKYSTADIDIYTENIIKQYTDTLKAIERYEEMVAEHIKKWRWAIKIQFEGVIGTFGGNMFADFFKQLKRMEALDTEFKLLELQVKETQTKGVSLEHAGEKLAKLPNQPSTSSLSPSTNIQKPSQPPVHILYQQTKKNHQQQKQKVQTFVQILKMSGTRNLSNLAFLYRSCKGFSEAVQILVNLEEQQTRRRFEFISRKVKVCSIETMYDADMINNGLLDNKIERPPFFDEVLSNAHGQSVKTSGDWLANKNKKKAIKFRDQISKHQPQSPLDKLFSSQSANLPQKAVKQQQPQTQISLLSSQSQRQDSTNHQLQTTQQTQLKNQIGTQYKIQVTNGVLEQEAEEFEKMKLAKLNSQKPFSNAILNMNKMTRDQVKNHWMKEKADGVQIDLEQADEQCNTNNHSDKSLPYPSMREYHWYQKNRNLFQPKLQLNESTYERFPPPEVYLPSVQSLTLKYTPSHIIPEQFLKQCSSNFRKLIELIIEEPKFATKTAIITIAEVFPKLKSLVIRCENEFDWELGKLFERKMKNLIRFQVSPHKGDKHDL